VIREDGRQQVTTAAAALEVLHRRLTALNPGAYLRAEHAERLVAEAYEPLRRATRETHEWMRRILEVCDGGDGDTGEWGEHLEPTDVHGGPLLASTLADELWQTVGNVAFAACTEIRRVERELKSGVDTHDQRVVACDSARRKLRRGIQALLVAIGQVLDQPVDLSGLDAEVERALAVRRLFAKFRHSFRPIDPHDHGQVRRSLRFAAVSLAVMVGSSDFAEVRAQDRQLLLGLQRRILAWARAGGAPEAGRQLYQDLTTAADLLRAINQRQELVAHDRVVLKRVAEVLAHPGPPERALEAALPDLHQLVGRDDQLDELVARMRDHRGDDEAVLGRLRAAIERCLPPGGESAAA